MVCKYCNIDKDDGVFSKNRKSHNKLSSYCDDPVCRKEHKRIKDAGYRLKAKTNHYEKIKRNFIS